MLKKEKKARKNKPNLNFRLIGLILLVLILLAIQYFVFNPTSFDIKTYQIEDACGKTFKNAVHHTIDSQSLCKANCINLCGTYDQSYVKSIFTQKENTCNECECRCR
ncbi:MAG: hypothetical protein ACOCUI_03255 [bacterium]